MVEISFDSAKRFADNPSSKLLVRRRLKDVDKFRCGRRRRRPIVVKIELEVVQGADDVL